MKKKTIIIIILVLIIVFVSFILLRENRIFSIGNVKYGEIEKLKEYFDGEYKDYKFNKYVSHTRLEEYNSYIKLWSSNSFDIEYLANNHIKLLEGKYPDKEKEIIIHISMKKGYDSSKLLENKGYEIGDNIKLNVAPYYYEEYFSLSAQDTQFVKAKYDLCGIEESYEVTEVFEEYKIVGFYENFIDSEEYTDLYLKSYMINAITYEKNIDLDNDARVELIFKLKKIHSSFKKSDNKESKLRNVLNRYDESKYYSIKTCNDTLRYDYLTIKEIKDQLN